MKFKFIPFTLNLTLLSFYLQYKNYIVSKVDNIFIFIFFFFISQSILFFLFLKAYKKKKFTQKIKFTNNSKKRFYYQYPTLFLKEKINKSYKFHYYNIFSFSFLFLSSKSLIFLPLFYYFFYKEIKSCLTTQEKNTNIQYILTPIIIIFSLIHYNYNEIYIHIKKQEQIRKLDKSQEIVDYSKNYILNPNFYKFNQFKWVNWLDTTPGKLSLNREWFIEPGHIINELINNNKQKYENLVKSNFDFNLFGVTNGLNGYNQSIRSHRHSYNITELPLMKEKDDYYDKLCYSEAITVVKKNLKISFKEGLLDISPKYIFPIDKKQYYEILSKIENHEKLSTLIFGGYNIKNKKDFHDFLFYEMSKNPFISLYDYHAFDFNEGTRYSTVLTEVKTKDGIPNEIIDGFAYKFMEQNFDFSAEQRESNMFFEFMNDNGEILKIVKENKVILPLSKSNIITSRYRRMVRPIQDKNLKKYGLSGFEIMIYDNTKNELVFYSKHFNIPLESPTFKNKKLYNSNISPFNWSSSKQNRNICSGKTYTLDKLQ